MGIENIQNQRKGSILKASTVNALIDHAKNSPTANVRTGGFTNIRIQTLFYTDVDIPAYSIFPLIPNTPRTNNTFYAQYSVEQYDSDNINKYMSGYYGTNGRFPINAQTTFYGYILNYEHDVPIKVSDYEEGKTQCGFQDGSWEASIESDGITLNGEAPQSSKLYYARLCYMPDLEGWAEEDIEGFNPSEEYQIKLARDIKWNDKSTIKAGSSLLNFNSTIETGTPVLCRWLLKLQRWVVAEAACEPDPDYVPSSEEGEEE